MVLVNDQYSVTITVEWMPSLADYTIIYMSDNLDLRGYHSARLLKIEPKGGQPFFLALVELIASSATPCAVLENHILTVILFESILQINLNTGLIHRHIHCNNMGGLEQIHPIKDGYIIKGESDIFRYDSELNEIWHFSARDIFALPTHAPCFWIENNKIHCRDWEGWHYVLDLEGKLISEVLEKSPGS